LFAPGFNITPSRSGTITIGAKIIEAALASDDGVEHGL
jgi:hypothetical protein